MHSTTAIALAALSTVGRAMPQAAAPFSAYAAPWAAEHAPSEMETSPTASASIPVALTTATSYTNTVFETSTISTPEATMTETPTLTTETSYTNTVYITSAVTQTTTVDCGSGSMVESGFPSVPTSLDGPLAHIPLPISEPAAPVTTPCANTSVTYTYTVTPSASATSIQTSWIVSTSGNATFSYPPSPVTSSTDSASEPTGNVPFVPTQSGKLSAPFAGSQSGSESGAAEVQVAVAGVMFGFGAVMVMGMLL